MNTLLIIGICFITFGFVGFVVSAIMQTYYEVKLWELENRGKKKE